MSVNQHQSSARITVLHGDNTILSRKKLFELISSQKERGITVVRVDGASVQLGELEQHIQSTSLFGEDRILVIEKLWSQKSAPKKTSLINIIIKSSTPCILWHDKLLLATQLKPFITMGATIQLFKSSPEVYKTLDLLGSTNRTAVIQSLEKSIQADSAEYVFIQFVRHVTNLLLSKCNQPIAGPTFATQKITQQAKRFSLQTLLDLHNELVIMDRRIKTSNSVLTIEQFLTLMTIKMSMPPLAPTTNRK